MIELYQVKVVEIDSKVEFLIGHPMIYSTAEELASNVRIVIDRDELSVDCCRIGGSTPNIEINKILDKLLDDDDYKASKFVLDLYELMDGW